MDPRAQGMDLYKYLRSLQPDIIVNNRVERAEGHGGLTKGRLRRRLRHARAGHPRHRHCPARTGKPA